MVSFLWINYFLSRLLTIDYNNSQVEYAIKCMKHAIKKDLCAIEPKLAAQNAYTTTLKKRFTGTVWKSGCSSWYLNKDGDVSH